MTPPIIQKPKFRASARKLFAIYTTPDLHGEVTGGAAAVSTKAGAPFSAFDGELLGTILHVLPNRMVTQTWRSSSWRKADADSILVLGFRDEDGHGVIDLAHFGVPAHDHQGVSEGWRDYYWKPLRAYLAARRG